MITPLVRLIIAGAGILVSGSAVAFFKDELYVLFKGKRFAILGAKATGKTTLHNFLTNGELTGGTGIEKTKSHSFKLKDLKFHIRKGKDITGSEDFVIEWKKIISSCNYTFYMIDSERVYKNDFEYMELIENHLSIIGNYYEESSRKDKVNIVCAFGDKTADFTDNKNKFEKAIKDRLGNALNYVDCQVFVGSLKTVEHKQNLVYTILETIKSN